MRIRAIKEKQFAVIEARLSAQRAPWGARTDRLERGAFPERAGDATAGGLSQRRRQAFRCKWQARE